MEDLIRYEVDEVTEKEGFVVDNDNAAEWCLRKIAQEKAEMNRQMMVIDYMIQEYQVKKNKVQDQFNKKTEYFNNLLLQYFETIDKSKKEETKTQEVYKLPSGTLKRKFGTIEYVKDDAELLEWLKTNKRNELIKVKEDPDWAALKKEINVADNGKVISADGEIIECIKVHLKSDKFEVEI